MSLLDSLAGTESGGSFDAQNDVTGAGGLVGHFGRLQFGQARLQDAMNAGVLAQGTTPQAFMADPQLQARVEQWHFDDMRRQAESLGLTRFVGQSINGVPITMDAILAMGHLGGMGGAQRFLESGGSYNPADAYGTSLLDYARIHGNASGGSTPAQPPEQPPEQPANALAAPAVPQGQPNALTAPAPPENALQQPFQMQGNMLDPNAFRASRMQQQPTNFLQFLPR